jgi:hypothetical protein
MGHKRPCLYMSGTSEVPQLAAPLCATPKSAGVGHEETLPRRPKSVWLSRAGFDPRSARPARQAGPGCRRGYGVAGIERDEFIRRIAAAILSGRRKSGCTQPIHRTQSPCDVCRGQGYSGPRPRVLTRELGKYHQTTAPRGFEGAARSVNTVSSSTGEPGGDRRKAN